MGANLHVMAGADKRAAEEIYKAVNGQPYYSPCLNTYHKYAIEIVRTIRSLPAAKGKALAADCARRMAAAKPDNLGSNWGHVVNETYYRDEKEPCGFLGLGRKTVRKRYTRPRAAAKPYLDLLRGESFHVIYREHENDERGSREDEYDHFILVTQSGRCLRLSFTVRFDYSAGGVCKVDLHTPGTADLMSVDNLIHLGVEVAKVIGKAGFDQLTRQYA